MSNSKELRNKNYIEVIRALFKLKEATKPDIARRTGLTTVTINAIMGDLAERGVCAQTGQASSNGGRKAVLYKINEAFGYLIGVEINRDSLKIFVFDLSLRIVYEKDASIDYENVSQSIAAMTQHIEEAISEQKDIPREKYLKIGVTVPGQADRKNGVVTRLPDIKNWNDIPIKMLIENRIKIPVILDNDVNAHTLAAIWNSLAAKDADMVFVNITSGVGSGIYINGSLFYGANSRAGEIGHATIKYDGPMCKCGNRGCAEAFVCDDAILGRLGLIEAKAAPNTIDEAISIAKGDPGSRAYGVFRETADYIAILIDHIVKIYDPRTIIIENTWLCEIPSLFYHLKDEFFKKSPWVKQDSLNIIIDKGTSSSVSTGCLALNELLCEEAVESIFLRRPR